MSSLCRFCVWAFGHIQAVCGHSSGSFYIFRLCVPTNLKLSKYVIFPIYKYNAIFRRSTRVGIFLMKYSVFRRPTRNGLIFIKLLY